MQRHILLGLRTYALMSRMPQPWDANAMIHSHSRSEHCRAHGVDWIDKLARNVQQLSWSHTDASCLEHSAAGSTGLHTRQLSKLFIDYSDSSEN